jgi:hypothetical protein
MGERVELATFFLLLIFRLAVMSGTCQPGFYYGIYYGMKRKGVTADAVTP